MKNKIVLTFMVLSLSAMLFGCGTNAESETTTNSSNNIEETGETKGTNETDSELETEELNNTNYEFEGRYWVVFEAEYALGYYFDGTNLTALVTGGSENVTPYSVKNGLIIFEDGYECSYYLDEGNLYLVPTDESMEIYCEEVDKAEFDSLFSEKSNSEETPTTEEVTKDTEEPTTEEVTNEVQNNYTYDFEGKYWKSDDGYSAMYFDGVNYILKGNGYSLEGPYTVDTEYMMIILDGEPFANFSVSGSTFTTSDEWGTTSTYTEVTKEEFEKLFN